MKKLILLYMDSSRPGGRRESRKCFGLQMISAASRQEDKFL